LFRTFLKAAAVPFLLAVSCSGLHRPALDDYFIDPDDCRLRKFAADTIRALESAIFENGDDPDTFRRLAVCYRAIGTPGSRIRSMQAIDRAIELDPDNALYHVERGLTLYARQFTGSAIKSFDRAIVLDPGCFEAWYLKGRIEKDLYLRDMCSERHHDDAIRFLGRALNIRGGHEETLFDLGLLQYLKKRLDICSSCAATGAELYPYSYRFRLLSSCVALERMDFEAASEGFDSALVLMDAGTREIYEDVSMLLGACEIDHYIHLHGRNRDEFTRKFWVRNDPTPATALNERRLEHYRRTFLASELLACERRGLCGLETARGMAVVRYGLPDAILLDMGSGLDGPFVLWTYMRDERTFLLYFQDEFLNGDFHIPIDPRFRARADMTESTFQTTPQMYRYPVEYTHLPVGVESVQFRGSDDDTRVDFAIALPDSLLSEDSGPYRLDLTIFDNDLNVFRSDIDLFDPDTLSRFDKSDIMWRSLRLSLNLPPLQLESSFAIEITGGRPAGRALFRGPLTVLDPGGGRLSLSGIKLSLPDKRGGCTDMLDPLPSYSPGSSLCVYYEIYSLKRNGDNVSKYRVTWSVASDDPGEGDAGVWSWIKASVRGSVPEPGIYISSSIDQSASTRSVGEDLELDVSILAPGRYVLILEIEDLVAKSVTSGSRRFAIIPRTGT
jgi:GWxTD domain-containing protein